MKKRNFSAIVLILSDARGIYITRDFLTDDNNEIAVDHCSAWGLTEENRQYWEAAANPEDEWYWEAWTWICDNAKYVDESGNIFTLYQDGDLWGLCVDRMSAEEKQNFGFED